MGEDKVIAVGKLQNGGTIPGAIDSVWDDPHSADYFSRQLKHLKNLPEKDNMVQAEKLVERCCCLRFSGIR